ncbi:hypothetical protein LTR95_003733, partial [Oleoguttula sp. CCFEE 5521]
MVHGFHVEDEVRLQAKKAIYTCVTPVDSISSDKTARSTQSSAKAWKPITLRLPYLSSLILITLALIAIIQWLLLRSRADQGILFAPNINELPLRTSFLYLYLPTLIPVIYSFLWTWVDLDVKRLEPFFQLSKTGGATAEQSILLHYPFDFLASVPLKAVRRKNWSVFATLMIMVLVFWGLTPIQAGIFAVRTVTVHDATPIYRATGHITTQEQGEVTASYPQSVYNIAWLNETTPHYMTLDYILAAVEPSRIVNVSSPELSYTGVTTMYSVDLDCETPPTVNVSRHVSSTSSSGCTTDNPANRYGETSDTSKIYEAVYLGHMDSDGTADWYLNDYCRDTFWARFSKTTPEQIAAGVDDSYPIAGQAVSTQLFCTADFYQQEVNATVTARDKRVLSIQGLSAKAALPPDLFNTTILEWALTAGNTNLSARANFPARGFPCQESRMQDLPLNLQRMSPMIPIAIATHQRPMDDYMDPETMRLTFQAAYRLLFARQLADILKPDLDRARSSDGTQTYTTQAMVVIPGFAYAATALLAFVTVLATWVIWSCFTRANKLQTDPASIAALIQLSQGSSALASNARALDQSSATTLHAALVGRQLTLNYVPGDANFEDHSPKLLLLDERHDLDTSYKSHNMSAGIRPAELRSWTGVIFLMFQLAAVAACLTLFVRSTTNNGIALPSQNTIVRQILENYIPIAIATLMEPFWLVLNRQICMLQP